MTRTEGILILILTFIMSLFGGAILERFVIHKPIPQVQDESMFFLKIPKSQEEIKQQYLLAIARKSMMDELMKDIKVQMAPVPAQAKGPRGPEAGRKGGR